jgi:hypothetical protein
MAENKRPLVLGEAIHQPRLICQRVAPDEEDGCRRRVGMGSAGAASRGHGFRTGISRQRSGATCGDIQCHAARPRAGCRALDI